jgi:hypothetical protein
VTKRPERVIGLHFFSPANVMRLVEVVRGARSDVAVAATAIKLARTIGKVPVLARVCHGFIANRLMMPRGEQAEALLLGGSAPESIDRVMTDYGFPMGPFQLDDLVGLDVLGRDAIERTLRGDLVAAGRFGQKNGGGFYDYDAQRNATPSPAAAAVIVDFRLFKGIIDGGGQDDDAILARLLYPLVNRADLSKPAWPPVASARSPHPRLPARSVRKRCDGQPLGVRASWRDRPRRSAGPAGGERRRGHGSCRRYGDSGRGDHPVVRRLAASPPGKPGARARLTGLVTAIFRAIPLLFRSPVGPATTPRVSRFRQTVACLRAAHQPQTVGRRVTLRNEWQLPRSPGLRSNVRLWDGNRPAALWSH